MFSAFVVGSCRQNSTSLAMTPTHTQQVLDPSSPSRKFELVIKAQTGGKVRARMELGQRHGVRCPCLTSQLIRSCVSARARQ
jgi:hypothetical protein